MFPPFGPPFYQPRTFKHFDVFGDGIEAHVEPRVDIRYPQGAFLSEQRQYGPAGGVAGGFENVAERIGLFSFNHMGELRVLPLSVNQKDE